MKKILTLLALTIIVTSCNTAKKASTTATSKRNTKKYSVSVPSNNGNQQSGSIATGIATQDNRPADKLLLLDNVINEALGYLGTKYKYGGTTRKGMDCSGLVYTSFLSQDVSLERSSYLMAEQGESVSLKKVVPGDLLFFITGRGRRINHVGLVVEATNKEVKFIHSTTSRGVIISSLSEGYWGSAFKFARRMQL